MVAGEMEGRTGGGSLATTEQLFLFSILSEHLIRSVNIDNNSGRQTSRLLLLGRVEIDYRPKKYRL